MAKSLIWLCVPENFENYFYSQWFKKLKEAKKWLSERNSAQLVGCRVRGTTLFANLNGWILLDPNNKNYFWWFSNSVDAWKYKRQMLKRKNAWKIGPFIVREISNE